MNISFKKIHAVTTSLSFIISFILAISYIYTYRLDILLFLLWSSFISVSLYCFTNIKYYIIHFFFYLTIFVFLVSRPTIDYLRVPIFNTYQKDAYVFSFIIVIIALLGLFLGGIIATSSINFNKVKEIKNKKYNDVYLKNLRIVSLIVYCISYPFFVLRLVERLIFRMNTTYYIYYAQFESKLPYFTYTISTFMLYSMCLYLACKPKKKSATIVLISYIMANTIYLIIGTRNPFILSLIFSFIYYFIRNQESLKKQWFGFKEKFLIIISIPSLMVGMGLLNYIRDKVEIDGFKFFGILLDFIYKQGTSFGVLARGYLYNSNLPVRSFSNYTFGSFIEYIVRGNLGLLLFDSKPYVETTNSIELALKSNSYAHNLSYIVLKDEYLNGHGLGGSYIMDNFTDYGYIGVFLFSLFLGYIFVKMINSSYKNNVIPFTCTLVVLNNLFFMPRSSFSETFLSLITLQFWGIVLLIFFGANLIKKDNSYVLLKKEEEN